MSHATTLSATAEQVLATLRAHEPELRAAGIRRLSLFGSVARGDDAPGSDADLAAELDPAARIGLFALAGLERRIGEMLGRKVDLLPNRSRSRGCAPTSRGIASVPSGAARA
jgi:predicted nucleotidyltransferase